MNDESDSSSYFTAEEDAVSEFDVRESENYTLTEQVSSDGTRWIIPLYLYASPVVRQLEMEASFMTNGINNFVQKKMGDLTLDTIKAAMKDSTCVIKFTASWCGPCKKIAVELEKSCKENKFTLIEVDIDEHQEIAEAYRIKTVPTCYICFGGEKATVVGANMAAIQKNMIDFAAVGEQIQGDIPVLTSE